MNDHVAIDQFLGAMREQDIVPGDTLKFDGTLERFYVEGDRKGSRNGWCILHIDANPAGQFGCNKRHGDHKFSWRAERDTKPMSAADKKAQQIEWARKKAERDAAERQRHADAAARAQSMWAAAKPATNDHPYLVRKGVKSHGLRVGSWEFVNAETGEIFTLTDNALLVPICDRSRTVHSLQGIFPGKILGKGDGARDKDYLKHGAKIGLFHAIGRPQMVDDCPVFIICEGYATGASIHEATGHLVLVTFDTSNLLPVADAIRESKPDAIIVLAADNDQWTTKPVANPGVHFATRAAASVSGLIAVPPFAADAEGQPTDFNDLAQREGNEAVAAIFEAVIAANKVAQDEPEPTAEVMPWDEAPPDYLSEDMPLPTPDGSEPTSEPSEPAKPAKPAAPALDDDELVNNAHFTILGYDGDTYYLFQHEKRQVMAITKGDLSDVGLIELADLYWWEMNFSNGKGGIEKKAVAQWLFRLANSRGIYNPDRIRGRGAWEDKKRAVFHHGNYLTVDGVPTEITKIKSAYVYPMSRELPQPHERPLTDAEGRHLVEVASLVRWSMPGSAALMAGYSMLAPICGALSWRPHIWLTGPAGSGKSTVQNKFCAGLAKGIAVYAQGNSTEAGIRQKLKADALPVLIDEAESNNERDKQRIENIMSLIRQTSSESQAETLKGTVSGDSQHYQIRSMFCLASINVNLPTKADIDRLTKLVIKAPKDAGEDNWPRLEAELNKIDQDETISARLLARALELMPVIKQSIDVFRRVAAKHFGSQRDGDQFGTLLAGCWCLMNSHVPSDLDASILIDDYQWDEHTEDQDQDDSTQALSTLLGAKIRMGGSFGDLTVFELVRESSTSHRLGSSVSVDVADETLRRHGIIADTTANKLLFGTSVQNLKDLIERMPGITDLRGQLLRINGAERVASKSFLGSKSKCVSIPLAPILGDAKEQDNDTPF